MVRLNASSGAVEVFDDSGALQWSGRPLGHAASVVLPISGTNDAIVLLDPDACRSGSFRNLLRVSANGSVMWQAELPDRQGNDAYVAVRWAGAQLLANTWSTYLVRLDVESGRILESTFTK
jgi:hypothetical protein